MQEKLDKKTAKLNAKITANEEKIKAVKEKITNVHTLPDDVLLSVKGLKMYFGGLKAVDDLTFEVKKGEIFGLIGPNGAGKTTVFNCITRFYNATAGEMYFENKQGEVVDLRDFEVHDVILQGISRTFQNVELVREISVLENLLVACTREYRSSILVHALGLPVVKKEEKLLRARALKVLKFMGIESYANWLCMGLPYGILKKVEIARALMSNAKLIIMDEPAAGLNDTETAELTETIRRIRDEFNTTILLVEHDMKLVMGVCDTVCAISFGKMLAIGDTETIKNDKAVQEAYLGVEGD
ncbi:MAG: ABC transporter ATP-binding protein [Clostridia bacterium]|nr:ABC transporter ATP-binding protein [Clostridia bacterium]